MTYFRLLMTTTASVLVLAAAAGSAQAAGFALQEGATDWMANAYAGETAKAYDASTAWSNPAGMALLSHNEIDASLNGIVPNSKFTGTDTASAGAVSYGNDTLAALTGGAYGVWDYSPDLKFGMAVDSPFGERVKYPVGWTGGFQSLTSSVTDVAVQLSASYKIDDQWSVGGGPVIDYLYSSLSQELNTGALNALGVTQATVSGDNVSAGYDLSAMYQLDADTRFGLNYRSRITHELDGHQTVSFPAAIDLFSPATAALLAAENSSAHTDVTLPDSVRLGAFHTIDPEWSVMADLEYTDWSVFHELTIVTNNGLPPSTQNLDFNNAWFGSVGANYSPTLVPGLTLQSGLAYDESPVDNSNRTTRIPDSDRVILGIGASYQLFDDTKLHFAYAHFFAVGDNNIDNSSTATAGTIIGNYQSSADTFSIGVDYQF